MKLLYMPEADDPLRSARGVMLGTASGIAIWAGLLWVAERILS